MKILSNIKKSTRRVLLAGVVTAAVLGLGAFKVASASNVSFSSATDCDSNAVVYCGAMSVNQLINRYDNSAQATSIHHIYSYFGISSTEVHQMANANTNALSVYAGKVTIDGNVTINGQTVATNALTAGREFISGSTKVTFNGTTFYTRPPRVSFQNNALDAFVVKENGKFAYAIIASCGNPVKATPTPTPVPNYTINKEVAIKGTGDFQKSISNVKPGTHVIYRVVVKSTGNAAVKDLVVHDNLPKHVALVKNTLTRNGTNVTQTNEQNFFDGGMTIASLAAGDQVVFRFEAIVGPNDTATNCVNETLTNTGVMTATNLPKKNSEATVSKKCAPKPVYACTSLNAVFNSRTTYTFTARATATNGAVITKYVFNFGDSTSKTVTTNKVTATTKHSYPGNLSVDKNYTATVTVYVSVNGAAAQPVTARACRVTVTVKAQPLAECTDLRFTQNGRTVSVQAVVAPSSATINQVTYDFGDSTTAVMRNDLNTVSHTYANDVDQATITANVTFRTPQGAPASVCQAQVNFTNEVTTPPTKLVNTGPGSVAGLFAAVTLIGAFAHRIFLARRLDS